MRRAFILLASAVVTSGCSFPDPPIHDPVDAEGPDTKTGDATSDAQDAAGDSSGGDEGTDGVSDAGDGGDTGIGDTGVGDAAAGDTPDGSTCATTDPCDCDGDGDKATRTGCGGGDCDDGDSRRSSKVTSFQDHKVDGVTHGGDWDCNMSVVREYPDAINCGGLSLAGCSGQGYRETKPTCGGKATFVRCKASGISCVEDSAATDPNFIVKCK